jgi:hypothetical protein
MFPFVGLRDIANLRPTAQSLDFSDCLDTTSGIPRRSCRILGCRFNRWPHRTQGMVGPWTRDMDPPCPASRVLCGHPVLDATVGPLGTRMHHRFLPTKKAKLHRTVRSRQCDRAGATAGADSNPRPDQTLRNRRSLSPSWNLDWWRRLGRRNQGPLALV